MSTHYASPRVPRKQGTGVIGIVSVILMLLAVPIVGYLAWYVITHPQGTVPAKGGGPLASTGNNKPVKTTASNKFKSPSKSSNSGERLFPSPSSSDFKHNTPPPQMN